MTNFVGVTSITVGDPRPPTAQLTITTPDFVDPKGPLTVSASAQSFIGSSVAEAEITILWSAPSVFLDFDDPLFDILGSDRIDVNGTGTIITDENGLGSVDLDISDFSQFLQPFRTDIKVEAIWIGPTRERIRETDNVQVATGPVRVTISWLFQTALPGIESGVIPIVRDVAGEPVDYTSVTIYSGPMTEETIALWQETCNPRVDTNGIG